MLWKKVYCAFLDSSLMILFEDSFNQKTKDYDSRLDDTNGKEKTKDPKWIER